MLSLWPSIQYSEKNSRKFELTSKDVITQVKCMKPTWILTGVSVLKFSLDGALNVKQFDIHGPMKTFKRSVRLAYKHKYGF